MEMVSGETKITSSYWEVRVTKGKITVLKCMKEIQGKLILAQISMRFELARV